MTKIICIKEIEIEFQLASYNQTIVLLNCKIDDILYSSILPSENHSLRVRSDLEYPKGVLSIKDFDEHFATMSEFRENRINEILND